MAAMNYFLYILGEKKKIYIYIYKEKKSKFLCQLEIQDGCHHRTKF